MMRYYLLQKEFVAGRVDEASPNTINLMVKTRDARGNRNPHFEGDRRAHLLVDRIFEELESEAIAINSLRVSWAKPSQKMPYIATTLYSTAIHRAKTG